MRSLSTLSFLFVVFVACAAASISVSPSNFIGTPDGTMPLVFTGQTWDANGLYTLAVNWVEDNPTTFPCAVNASNSAQLLCNAFQTSVIDITNTSIWSQGLALSSQSKYIYNFQFWPVSAPLNTPTQIFINVTIDASRYNYKFDRTGATTYRCVWSPSSAMYYSKIGSAFSIFTPDSDWTGSCFTPNLGNPAPTGLVGDLLPAGPVMTTFYVIGTDSFASMVCETTWCPENFYEFDFTPEVINQLGSPYSPALSSGVISHYGDMIVTITGTGFRQNVGTTGEAANYPVSYYCYYLDASINQIGHSGGYEATYISSTEIACPTPTEDASTSEVDIGYIDLYLNRQDDCELACTDYRIARFNMSYVYVYADSVGPQTDDDYVNATVDHDVYFTGQFISTLPHWCIFTNSDASNVWTINKTATAVTTTQVTCTTPDLTTHKVKTEAYINVDLYEGPNHVGGAEKGAQYFWSLLDLTSGAEKVVFVSVVVVFSAAVALL